MADPLPQTSGAAGSPLNLRILGRVRVLNALADGRLLSRPELVKRTGLARATVSSVVTDLTAAGLVSDQDGVNDGGGLRTGRPARLLGLVPTAAHAVGIDIGHDHLRCMLCDLVGQPVWDQNVDVAVDAGPDVVLARAAELIAEAVEQANAPRSRIIGVGVGIASPVDHRSGSVRGTRILPGWGQVRPTDELAARTGLPMRLVNDANAGVLAERRYGAARDVDDVIYIELSSGIGLGVVCGGRMLLGAGGLAGELGHVSIEPDGVICRCGTRGCLETVASPMAISEQLSRSWARPVSMREFLDLITAGDRGAIRAVQDAGDLLGRALSATVMILNPELVVVGGELAAAGDVLFDSIRRAIIRDSMDSHTETLRIVPAALGDSAAVRGAAGLVLSDAAELLAAAVSAG